VNRVEGRFAAIRRPLATTLRKPEAGWLLVHGGLRYEVTVTKTVLLLCLIVLAGACGVIYALGQVSADLRHATIVLDALVGRVASVEDDLQSISEDVYSIADDVNALADALADEEDDDEDTEAVGWQVAAARARHAHLVLQHAAHRDARLHRHAAGPHPAAHAHHVPVAAVPGATD
jgi:hypothetical protein